MQKPGRNINEEYEKLFGSAKRINLFDTEEEYNELRESIARQIDLGHGLLEALKYPKDSPVFIWALYAIDFLNSERFTERNKWPKYPYHVAASVLLPD